MPLSQEQKDRLRKQLVPLVQEALQEQVSPMVKSEVQTALAELRDDNEDYEAKIFSTSDRRHLREGKDAGLGVARIARCLALAKNDLGAAAKIAEKDYDDALGTAVMKTLNSGEAEEGGVFVPEIMASTFIDALRAKAVVRSAGPIELDLSGGNLRIPRVTTDPTAGWVGEGKKRKTSNMKTGDLNFVAKTLQGKSSATQQLLRRSSQSAENIIRNGLIRVMANVEDQALLRGVGSEASPKGMTNWAVAANKITATQAGAAATLTEVQEDLRKMISLLTGKDVDTDMAAWFWSPRSREYLAFSLRDTEDRPVFKSELTAATSSLNGYPDYKTNNIPNNLGGGNNESQLILTAMDEAWIADEQGLRVRASTEASFTDENDQLVSAFDKNLMVMIIERDMDFAMAHGEATAVLSAVKWGV